MQFSESVDGYMHMNACSHLLTCTCVYMQNINQNQLRKRGNRIFEHNPVCVRGTFHPSY